MGYRVKEIFKTLQGEGGQAGQTAMFCRFVGCNLWSGREEDRARAICRFCDTDFLGTDGPDGGRFEDAQVLASRIETGWGPGTAHRLVVFTGGEPLLQLDRALIDAMHARSFRVAVETNGTLAPPEGIDWLCVSPKAGTELVVRQGQELKLVFPQSGIAPETLSALAFERFFLQPMDGPAQQANTRAALDYCLANPQWRLSLQMHKMVGIR